MLTAPGVAQGQFRFLLTGESNLTYTIETSADFVTWTSIAMSSAGNSQRLIVVPATNVAAYFRARESTPFFARALAAKGLIDLWGNNVVTDSFDSSDPAYSTNESYDGSKAKDHGDVATDSTIINSISLGNADVYGRVSTGLGGSITIGPLGSVGDNTWHASHSAGVQPGYITDDFSIDFPDVNIPFSGGYVPYIPTNGLGTGNYAVLSYSMSSGILQVNGNAVLYVQNEFTLNGTAQIFITPGASLKLYVGGSGSISGSGILNNNGASHFIYYGLPSSTSLSLGNSLVGCIYAPSADFAFYGSGNNTYDLLGAIVSKTARLQGHLNIHFDENLARIGPMW